MKIVYNIFTKYIKNTDIAVIENLNKGLIISKVEEEANIKIKPRQISKNVGKVKRGEKVNCYYTTSKEWRLIRTEDGILGYVKANTLAKEEIKRQDYKNKIKTT